jgi:hypothetical protein
LKTIVPYTDLPEDVGLLVHVHVALDGSSDVAQRVYAKFVQGYAERLANESARQEASARAAGASSVEITESSIIRASESLEEQVPKRIEEQLGKRIEQQLARRQRPANLREAAALAGTPIFSGAAGVMGSYLHSPWQVTLFVLIALVAIVCILYLLKRRLL